MNSVILNEVKTTVRDSIVAVAGLTASQMLENVSIFLSILVSAATFVFVVLRIIHLWHLIQNEKARKN